MKLDIIIPQYSEDDTIAKRLLDSINNQDNIDFNDINITIINDKSNVLLSSNLFLLYPRLNIKYLINEKNTGPGLARQYGIERTNGDYIMFIDCDDILFDKYALYVIMGCLSDAKPDLLITNIVKEAMINNEIKLLVKKKEETYPWLHGKVFKREFLNNNDIRFNPNLRHLEDSYFWTSVIGMINYDNLIYLDFNSYLWKYSENSITRKKGEYEYIITCFDDYFNCPFYAYGYLDKHNSEIKNMYIIRAIFDILLIIYSDIYTDKALISKKDSYISRIESFISDNKNIYSEFDSVKLSELYDVEVNKVKNKYNVKDISLSFKEFKKLFMK